MSEARWFHRSFRSLRHRNYRLYFIGQMVSLIGSWMQTAILTWIVFEMTGLSRWPAYLSAVQIGPTFLLGPLGGWLADHFPRRPLIMFTQFAYLTITLGLVALLYGGYATPHRLLGVMFLAGLVQAIDLPARLAYVPNLVPPAELINAVGLNSVQFNIARLIGPAVAGLMLLWFEPWVCVFLNACSYVGVIIALYAMDIPKEARRTGPRASIWSGFRELWLHPRIGIMIALAGTMALFAWPLLTLLPAYTANILHAQHTTYSLLLSSIGAGALCAAFSVATFVTAEHQIRWVITGMSIVAGALLILSLTSSTNIAFIACSAFGFGMILFFATGQTIVQLRTTNVTRGRVMGIWAMIMSGGVPIGSLILGPIADRYGVASVLMGQAVVTLSLWLIALLGFRWLHGLTARREVIS